MGRGRKTLDLTGQKYNRLSIVSLHGKNKRGLNEWVCQCDCGNQHVVTTSSLRIGAVKSCGCLGNESRIKNITKCNDLGLNNASHNNVAHGLCKDKLYILWKAIKRRCTCPKDKRYSDYGGRGITICSEWLNNPEIFIQDMREGYSSGLSIDRIDNNKGYYKENCKWSTRSEQQRNKRNNHYIEYNGENKTIAQWAEILNVHKNIISYRGKHNIDLKGARK